jgi:formamidopyrimidine-DNA glycosylase
MRYYAKEEKVCESCGEVIEKGEPYYLNEIGTEVCENCNTQGGNDEDTVYA